jgi:hypothetical protein
MWPSNITIDEETDPAKIARIRENLEHFTRNSDWLAAHWPDVLPEARGKFIAVADQEPFLGNTLEEAWEWVRTSHPADKGPLVRYVRNGIGPRIYSPRLKVA